MKKNPSGPSGDKNLQARDTFYDRLDFYRLLESGQTDLNRIAEALGGDLKVLRRWRRLYQPERGPFVMSASAPIFTSPATGSREDILVALRRTALEGNVPAAKLLLTEYEQQPVVGEEILTVEKAAELMREWFGPVK